MIGEKGSVGILAPWAIPPYNKLSQTWGLVKRLVDLLVDIAVTVIEGGRLNPEPETHWPR